MTTIIAVCALVVVQVPAWLRIRTMFRRAKQYEATLQILGNDMRALCAGSASASEHMARIEQQLHRLTEHQDQITLREPVSPAYSHAIKLVKKGASVDELVASCGLVRGEAELLVRLHRLN